LERYSESTRDRTWNLQSVTKSVLSTLVGIAVAENKLDLDDTVAELLPDHAAGMSSEFKRVTLRHLLTMTAGLIEYDATTHFASSADWVETITSTGNLGPVGTFAYGDDGPHLISAILAKATGMSVLAYARAKLFDPLGISTTPAAEPKSDPNASEEELKAAVDAYEAAGFAWPTDPQGVHIGSYGLKLTPRDMLKIGQLYLDKGQWNGRSVVPASWIEEATTPANDGDYGYLWWKLGVAGESGFAALGSGGQIIVVVPERRLIVVASSELRLDESEGLDFSILVNMIDSAVVPSL
jgi:CubicO group peptidase (beta-lactamase class C family)